MAFSVCSCLNQFLPLRTSFTKSSPSSKPQVGWRPWKTQYALAIACSIILGAETCTFAIDDHAVALTLNMRHQQESRADFKSMVERWSDKRSCPPWRLNSLETIVPENLPRPSVRRRWEFVDFSENQAAAGVIVKVAPPSKQCFFL